MRTKLWRRRRRRKRKAADNFLDWIDECFPAVGTRTEKQKEEEGEK